ncbi:hypothetical protein ACFPTX_02160 [Pseudomonas sp. GCM10022188]|uniref:hypothetical protein n=1 Tax=Pseudomonas TaxID=286 RepID=UPI001E48A556|nr:hypothetical protein [Pseudomonas oryzagri]
MAHNAINRRSRGDRTLTPGKDGIYSIELAAKATPTTPATCRFRRNTLISFCACTARARTPQTIQIVE